VSIGPLELGEHTRYQHPSADAAKAAAEEDFRQIQMLGAWFTYMADNPPPG
jgi:hypothetical protein